MIVERPALEARVLASLDAGRTPVVLGPCGSGRTSLLLRLAGQLGVERAQYLDFAAVTTTPERGLTAIAAAFPPARNWTGDTPADSARSAFDRVLQILDETTAPDGGPFTFLLDDGLDVKGFESFPGLRLVQRELVARLGESRNRFVVASRFTARTHRVLRDATARYEVVHVPAMDTAEMSAMARSHGTEPAPSFTRDVQVLAAGRASYAALLIEAARGEGGTVDAASVMIDAFMPGASLAARCRESYELRLHRARGYSALKAILGILADREPLTLTEIARILRRTPGSAKDYLSWLEDVDLVVSARKRYSIEDPVVRLYARLYDRVVPPTPADVALEVRRYADSRRTSRPAVADTPPPAPEIALAAAPRSDGPRSGIIEID